MLCFLEAEEAVMVAALGHLSEYSPVWKNTNESRFSIGLKAIVRLVFVLYYGRLNNLKTLFADKNDNLKTIAKPAC